jgi:hypothetical protein
MVSGGVEQNQIEFSTNASILYAFNTEISDYSFSRVTVNANGATTINSVANQPLWPSMKYSAGRLYTTAGRVYNPDTFTLVGTLPGMAYGSPVEGDPTLGMVYYLNDEVSAARLLAFRTATLALRGDKTIPGFVGGAASLVRCGDDRLAYRMGALGGQIVILRTVLATADNDGDRMPDSWESTFFGNIFSAPQADYDGDGISNLQEYLNDTDPTDRANTFRIQKISRKSGKVELRFYGMYGRLYQLEQAATVSGVWSNAGPVLRGQGLPISITNTPPQNAPRQFYRARLLP